MASYKYNKISPEFCQRIITATLDGDDWQSLAEALGVNCKTAYTWISHKKPLSKGGKKKKLDEEQINALCDEIEKDPALTLVPLSNFSQQLFGIALSASTVHNYCTDRLSLLLKSTCVLENRSSGWMRQMWISFVAAARAGHLKGRWLSGLYQRAKTFIALVPSLLSKLSHVYGAFNAAKQPRLGCRTCSTIFLLVWLWTTWCWCVTTLLVTASLKSSWKKKIAS